jgi:hypothetical protein
MNIFLKYTVKQQPDNSFVVIRPRFNYPNQIRIVSDDFEHHKDAEEFSYALNLKIVKEVRKGIITIT